MVETTLVCRPSLSVDTVEKTPTSLHHQYQSHQLQQPNESISQSASAALAREPRERAGKAEKREKKEGEGKRKRGNHGSLWPRFGPCCSGHQRPWAWGGTLKYPRYTPTSDRMCHRVPKIHKTIVWWVRSPPNRQYEQTSVATETIQKLTLQNTYRDKYNAECWKKDD